MILDILTVPHPTLSTPAVAAVPGPELSLLLHSMVETLRATPNAIGLAAPQVGVSLRAFVMGTEEQGYMAVVNPVIVKQSGIKVSGPEECLSVPGTRVVKKRSATITVRGIDAEGNPCEFTCKGLAARAVAHEIDHLDGKTIG